MSPEMVVSSDDNLSHGFAHRVSSPLAYHLQEEKRESFSFGGLSKPQIHGMDGTQGTVV